MRTIVDKCGTEYAVDAKLVAGTILYTVHADDVTVARAVLHPVREKVAFQFSRKLVCNNRPLASRGPTPARLKETKNSCRTVGVWPTSRKPVKPNINRSSISRRNDEGVNVQQCISR